MDLAEAMALAGKSDSLDPENLAEKLVEMFPKSIEEYTADDFLNTTTPYEYIWYWRKDAFMQKKLIAQMSAQAKKCKVTGFIGLYKAYIADKPETDTNVGGNVTAFIQQPIELRCGRWVCNNLGVRIPGEETFACPHPIMPVARLQNIDTGIEKVKVAFSRGRGWRTAIFDRKTISTANKIVDLSDSGIAVTSETAKSLVKYFYDVEQENADLLPEIECVTHLGWIDRGQGREFVPYTKDVVFDGEAEYFNRFNCVTAHGDLVAWKECIDENIRHNNQVIARIVFASALASVLVKPLNCNCFWVHLWGETETAKTVLTMCAASIWGNPLIGKFITTFNSTYVGNEKGASFSGSLPYMLDELTMVDSRKDMDQLIYMLTEGCGRSRGNKQGGLDAVAQWKNCTISTGERPINTGRSNGGAVNRVIECECKEYFFEDARRVAQTVQANYGLFGKAYIGYLRKDGAMEHAADIFEGYSKELTERKITQKQAQSAALILTADKLACELLFEDDTCLTVDEIAEFLKTKDEVSTNPRAYEYICEQVAANQLHFVDSDKPVDRWGMLDSSGASAYIIKSVFTRMCEDGGYNPASLLSWLADRKLIEKDKNGRNFTVPKRIGGVLTRCVHLTLSEHEEEEIPDF